MEFLRPQDGWFPLSTWAPTRHDKVVEGLPPPLAPEEWTGLGRAAQEALATGHSALVSLEGIAGPSPSVHADCRLNNVVARRKEGGGWEVKFLDFAWSGIEGHTR